MARIAKFTEQTVEAARNSGDILTSAAGQGRVIQRVETPPRKAGQPPGSESLEADW